MTKDVLLCVVLLLASARQAECTDCLEATRRQAFKKADVVFRGVVTEIEDPVSVDPIDPLAHKVVLQPAVSGGPRVVTFRVSRGWKGSVTPTMKVLVFARPTRFDTYDFHAGVEYVVYGYASHEETWELVGKVARGQTVYGIGVVCRLRVRADVAKESKALGKGRPPQ